MSVASAATSSASITRGTSLYRQLAQRGIQVTVMGGTVLLDPRHAARVIDEAMASGLPVVAHRDGGDADVIDHGINGVLFDDAAEALEWIERLRLDAALAAEMGRQARLTMEALHGAAMQADLIRLYLQGEGQPAIRLQRSAAAP